MTEKVAAQFKKLLLARRDDLTRKIVHPVTKAPDESPQVLPPDEPVVVDSAPAVDIAPSTQDAHTQELIAQMDAALARIAAGTYGECIGCKKEIGTKRLVAFPCARYCLACASTFQKHR